MEITNQQPIYEGAIFECMLCHHSFQLSLVDIKALLNPFHFINSPSCHRVLSLAQKSRLLLVKRLNSMVRLSQLLVGFAISYFIISVIVISSYDGIVGGLFLLGGFLMLTLLRFWLKKPIADLCFLEPVKITPLA